MYLVRSSWLIQKIYSQALWRKDSSQPFIYLTFDDGPIPEITPWVLELLSSKKIPATFFCVGENIKKHPDIFQEVIKKHKVGNHTFNHLNGWNVNLNDYLKNTEECDTAINSAKTGQRKLFRPPYGKMKSAQITSLSQEYLIVMWDVLSGDFDKSTSPEKCLKNACNNIRNGSIIVFHDNIKAKRNLEYALPRFIDFALSKGYTFKLIE